MTRQEIQKIIIGIILFFGLIFLYVVEFPYMNNTMQFSRLLLFGLLGSTFLAILLIWFKHTWAKTLYEKFVFSMGTLVVLYILTPLCMSLFNRLSGESEVSEHAFELLSISARSEQAFGILDTASISVDGYRLKVLASHGESSFYIKKKESVRILNDSIYVPMKQGGLGYAYLYEK